MNKFALTVENLTKVYLSPKTKKHNKALNELSFEVRQGEIFGLLGPNGAGKPTTIGILTGLVNKTSGNAKILNHDIISDYNKGFLSEDDIIWRFLLSFVFSNFVMISVSSLCLLFSSFSKNSVTPIISTISIVFIGTAISFIPIDIFELIDPYLFTGYIDIFLLAFYDPVPYDIFMDCFIVCFLWSTLFISIAYYNFTYRDILE